MTYLCPRPVLGYHFLPSLLRSVFNGARQARPGTEAAGLSWPGSSLDPAPRGAMQLPALRPLTSARSLSRGCRSANLFRGGFPAPNLRLISPLSQNRGLVRREAQVISPSKRARPAEEGGIRIRFVRLSEHATAPTKGSERAAGYDLYSAYDYTVPPMEKALVKTDIQIALPSGCYGRVAPRSGLAAKHFIDVGAGVIDEDYRGNVGVVLFNFGKEKFEVKKGDRIAQLICERIFYPEIEEVQVLDDTERGSGGFGSTGNN
ncbi:deoxyuridine 5'-triphosphate nucleotidohydrolase, mitochondrial isoform X1 [Mesoplodon densirostris]|uniref:deoxyuridine 5'-triphosphate nucleotidohydrolase, mitochondrial isoform X1 n=1 Tax=Mesoplodon densirostris TaxID=48708 RepID=UPI0028DC56DF|nr:deoxyuridine 5'-triphosphate nucleotidohydrolase, mitochondrial isoform X1 [Mesoplodon densirostris]